MKPEILTQWTSENSAELYGIRNWGSGYFDISENGHVIVKPHGCSKNDTFINLLDIIKEIEKKDFNMPVLIRFGGIVASQIKLLNESFQKAIKELAIYWLLINETPIHIGNPR